MVILIIVAGVVFLLVSHLKKERGGKWLQFFAKGKEEGFSLKEVEMLRQLAVQCHIEFPISVFTSQAQLDQCISSMVRSMKMSGTNDEHGSQAFLAKLYDYRKKIEIDNPKNKTSISGSRQISEGQPFRVIIAGTTGVYKSHLVKNTNQHIIISRPLNDKNTSASNWTGSNVSVYFWRENDAGYVFDAEVLDEVMYMGTHSIKITHGESLFRTQKRKSIRVKMHKAAFLYLVPFNEPAHQLEIDPGLKCFLEDMSDTGCAVTVGGKASSGLRVKVQFALDNLPVCMTGTVRSISFNEETGRSILHIEAEPLPVETRIHILGEVFGMLPAGEEDDEELPFRVLSGESTDDQSGFSDGILTAELHTETDNVMQET
ncbi:MAG: PilZ domain-containing protein [Treponema sp.]|nr:PilZ domain-containing protein [Treponema sp.]